MRRGTWSEDPRLQEIGALLFVVAFPLSCQIICDGPSYTGMRHFLFVVPPLAALAGIGMHTCLIVLKQKDARSDSLRSLEWRPFLSGMPQTLVRLHPYEYLFYNSLVGGLEGASRRYATDYWVNIMPAAVKDLETYLDQTGISCQSDSTPTLYRCGLWGAGFVRQRSRSALAIHSRLEPCRLLHCTHAHELRSGCFVGRS